MRVGIVTFYNGNINYGGILQAYALQCFIEGLGYECKQICLDNEIYVSLSLEDKIRIIWNLKFQALDIYNRKKKQGVKEDALKEVRKQQIKGFKKFERNIPHTDKCYKPSELSELNEIFDIFVCGSDQIWTPNSGGFRPVPHRWSYYLDFTSKKKISYAASFGVDRLPKKYEREVFPKIEALSAISVREYNAKAILDGKIHKAIDVVVDPVVLLKKEKWDDVVQKPAESGFVFSYILGGNQSSRIIAKKIAGEGKKQLITIPFIGEYIEEDYTFGDIQRIDATPEEFLGYIKYADIIITDSFHCAVFSVLFHKNFIVLNRTGNKAKGAMNARLVDFLSSIGLQDRIIEDYSQIGCRLEATIDYRYVDSILNEKREESIVWLCNALNG